MGPGRPQWEASLFTPDSVTQDSVGTELDGIGGPRFVADTSATIVADVGVVLGLRLAPRSIRPPPSSTEGGVLFAPAWVPVAGRTV